METITVTKALTEKIFAQWWADYLANPEQFLNADESATENAASADTFFDYAKKLSA